MNKLPFEEKFEEYNLAESVGLAVMVVKDGQTVFKQGYGLRNLETKESVNTDTNFRLCSVSKQFTAMCIAILEERGKISANDFIKKYFTDFPECMSEIKIQHLLNHTSGLPEYHNEFCSIKRGNPYVKNSDIYNYYKNSKSLEFKAGNRFEYSNGGYNLLATLVEKITKKKFSKFIKENIFKPLCMLNTKVVSYPLEIPNRSVSYSEWPFFDDVDFNTCNALIGEDGIYCSINDTEKWIDALERNLLINKETTTKLFAPSFTNDGEKINYGYGWELDKYYEHEMVLHTGSWVGFNTVIANYPKEKIWVVAYSNSHAISSWIAMEEMTKHYLKL